MTPKTRRRDAALARLLARPHGSPLAKDQREKTGQRRTAEQRDEEIATLERRIATGRK